MAKTPLCGASASHNEDRNIETATQVRRKRGNWSWELAQQLPFEHERKSGLNCEEKANEGIHAMQAALLHLHNGTAASSTTSTRHRSRSARLARSVPRTRCFCHRRSGPPHASPLLTRRIAMQVPTTVSVRQPRAPIRGSTPRSLSP